MKLYCARCLRAFESRSEREFCTPVCREAYDHAQAEYLARAEARMVGHTIAGRGSRPVAGGRQAIDFGLSDERQEDGR